MPMDATFHGITAVAELKPPRQRDGADAVGAFHGITAVAELKPGTGHLTDFVVALSTASPPWPN